MIEIFNSDNWGSFVMDDAMISASITVLKQYMDRLDAIKPCMTSPTLNAPAELDSQDSEQLFGDIDRQTIIHVSSF